MPAVVSDASVLIALGALAALELLRDFYGEVFVPPAVWNEVVNAGTRPGAEQVQLANAEGWLRVRNPQSVVLVRILSSQLDEGEAEAIALAAESPDSLLLMDESDGRQTAALLGIRYTGTVGVLLRARKANRLRC